MCHQVPEIFCRVRRTGYGFRTAPPQVDGLGANLGWSMKGFYRWPRVFRFATHYLGGQIGLRRGRWTKYEGRSACPHLRAWVQIWGGYRKAFNNVWSRIRPTRRRFRKESKSGSDRSRWSLQSLPVPAIPIRVAKNRKIQQDCARAQRRVCPRPPSVSFWDPASRPQLALGANCGHQSAFSFDRERPFSFRRNRKENGGSFPVSGHLQKIRPGTSVSGLIFQAGNQLTPYKNLQV